MVSALITVAVIAWCAQLALGGWQISRFNRAFDTLCQQGRVGVGRSSGRFKPRVVVAIALDDQQRHIMISPNMHVESIQPGKGIRYTALVKADNRLKDGNAQFCVSVVQGDKKISKVYEFDIPTAR